MNGFLIVDKPTNILSHDLTARVGRLYGTRAGHSGTLDPNVGGVMLIGLGRYTRLLRFFTRLDKTYVCLAKFDHEVEQKDIALLKAKVGKNAQIPPMHSAVAKKLRYRELYDLGILEVWKNRVLFKARVEAGFYMRVLCDQIGAKMEDLRRIAIGDINEDMSVNIYNIYSDPKSIHIYSAEEMFPYLRMNRCDVDENLYRKIINGVKLSLDLHGWTGMFYKDKLVAIMKDQEYQVVLT